MRKLSNGNKTNFAVFFIIIILIIGILFAYLCIIAEKEEPSYQLLPNSFFYDKDNNSVELLSKSEVEKKWDGNYIIDDSNLKYILGKNGIVFNKNSNTLDIFGTIYKVSLGAEVEKYITKTEILDYSENQLYKLDDRKYLIIGNEIVDSTGTLNTKNYLIVNIDKAGNTLLQNNEINSRTIKPMKILTSTFEFDVANEKLLYNGGEIDLKRIIGSTNEYIEKEEVVVGEETEDSDSNSGGNGASGGGFGAGGTINNNYNTDNSTNTDITLENSDSETEADGEGESGTGEEEGDKNFDTKVPVAKSVSLRSSYITSSSITINYSVTDIENMYQTVYIVLSGGKDEIIALDKKKTSYTITNLTPNTQYNISLNSKEITDKAEIKENIEDYIVATTKRDSSNIQINRLGQENISGTLKIDQQFVYQSAEIVLITNRGTAAEERFRQKVDISKAVNSNGWTFKFEHNGGTTFEVMLDEVYYGGEKIEPDVSAKVGAY